MCGICGLLDPSLTKDNFELRAMAKSMSDRLEHRGPDDQGQWVDREYGLALGHRRLSILDLSDGGRQPMLSASGRYVLVYNGEIYNYLELKEKLAKSSIRWRGDSDTEVLLNSFEQWGVQEALKKFNGMFAFAL